MCNRFQLRQHNTIVLINNYHSIVYSSVGWELGRGWGQVIIIIMIVHIHLK